MRSAGLLRRELERLGSTSPPTSTTRSRRLTSRAYACFVRAFGAEHAASSHPTEIEGESVPFRVTACPHPRGGLLAHLKVKPSPSYRHKLADNRAVSLRLIVDTI
jgi:hypothetical protein